jgi:hypothetical protein
MWIQPSAAFRKVAVGDTLAPFTLVDRNGGTVFSDSLWSQITILVAVDTIDVFTSKVLGDVVRLLEDIPTGKLAFRIIVEAPVDDGLLLKIPSPLRDEVIFDSSRTMDRILGFVVMPSTGVFSRDGRLLAYIPLWRRTFYDELARGVRHSLATDNASSLPAIWHTEVSYGELLQQVRTLAAQGWRDSSEALLSKQVSADTTWLEGLILLGNLKLDRSDYAGASRIFGRARASFPPSSEVFLGMAKAAVGLKELDSALAILHLGRPLAGRPEQILELEAEIFYQQHDLNGAIARWRQAIEPLLGIPSETKQ